METVVRAALRDREAAHGDVYGSARSDREWTWFTGPLEMAEIGGQRARCGWERPVKAGGPRRLGLSTAGASADRQPERDGAARTRKKSSLRYVRQPAVIEPAR